LDSKDAVDHVVGLLVESDNVEFAKNLLEFLPEDTLTEEQEDEIVAKYELDEDE
jgi:hypothetical protein